MPLFCIMRPGHKCLRQPGVLFDYGTKAYLTDSVVLDNSSKATATSASFTVLLNIPLKNIFRWHIDNIKPLEMCVDVFFREYSGIITNARNPYLPFANIFMIISCPS
jgi:hypothetical protein